MHGREKPMTCSPRTLAKIDRALASGNERERWQAAIALGAFAQSSPELIWPLILKHGSRRHTDARTAIATCVLEHLLEYNFAEFFPQVAEAARSNRWFRETFRGCWRFGQSKLPNNFRQWKRLERELDKLDRTA